MTDLLKLIEEMHFTHRNTTATNTTLPVDNCDLLKSGIKALLAENERLKKAADEHMYNCDSNPMGVMK